MHVNKSTLSRRKALLALGAGIAATGVAAQAFASPQDASVGSLEAAAESFRGAMQSGDGAALEALLHEQLTYSHSDGRIWTRKDLLDAVVGKNKYPSIETSHQTIYTAGQTGIVRHVFDVLNNLGDGKFSRSHILVLMCWVFESGANRWQLLARSSTNIPR